MEEVINPTGHNLESESRAVEKNVSSDRDREETYLERSRCGNHDDNRERTYLGKSRSGNRDGGEPGQELHREWKIHRGHWPNGQLENKNENIQKKNKRETHLGEWEESRDEENCGRRAREPAQGTKLNWACRPVSGGDKNGNKSDQKKNAPVCRYAE